MACAGCFLGYFSGFDAPLFKGIAPCGPLAAGDGILLGRLAEFLDRLRQAGRLLRAEHTPAVWAEALLGLLADFFDPGDSEEAQQSLQSLRASICALADDCRAGGVTGSLSPAVLRSYFRQELSVPAGGQAFLSGRVTFCNMVPMRSIPFAVICLLGMNDTDYPRHQNRVSFDMIAAEPRPGDRNRRDDDRYLFLESLLSARRVLYLSWVGRDQRDNSFRPPSVVVAELLDYLAAGLPYRRGRSSFAPGGASPAALQSPLLRRKHWPGQPCRGVVSRRGGGRRTGLCPGPAARGRRRNG